MAIIWRGVLHNAAGAPIQGASVHLKGMSRSIDATTGSDGHFQLEEVLAGSYQLSVEVNHRTVRDTRPINISDSALIVTITLSSQQGLSVDSLAEQHAGTGGEALSSQAVSELPLNKRDFSQLLLLAAGTMTDTNGATNFTQQFAINGQRGVEAVFAMDGADISDPEMGGSTFSNFNVDAVQEIRSSSGWMPAEIGRGGAGFTNIITRSGSSGFHGSVFEFVRNSAFDARNYFDHASAEHPERIPPFRRNEFGFTNGGPVKIPGIYNGRGKTYYFGQYQGFRQVLGTTQVFPVPTAEERMGIDTTAYPGDTLIVPVDPGIAKVLARYPLPNLPTGSYGVHTYATSSKVVTNADQFSIRLDHNLSEKNHLLVRFNFNNLTGPTTNPDQTAIDPSFGVQYIDRQRNILANLTRMVSPHFTVESSLSITRSTPSFPTPNRTDPALKFSDGSFEAFNSAAGSVMTAFGNLFQAQQNFVVTAARHTFKFGGEVRLNRDTTYFGTSPNGEYDFGGGTAYARSEISSQSGTHDIHAGDPLPDTLTGLLSGSPFIYTVAVAPSYFSNGEHIGAAAINRNAGAIYVQDSWKLSDRFLLDYGVRWEIYTPISERAKRTAGFLNTPSAQEYVINPQPGYKEKLNGWGPRLQLTWRASRQLQFHAGGAVTVIPPNIWQDNFLTGSTPFAVYPRLTAAKGAPVPFGFTISPSQLPRAYTPAGADIFASGNTKDVAPNTVMDINRYQKDVAALTPSHVISPLGLSGIDRSFGNGTLYTWTAGLERMFGTLTADVNYVGTAGVKLPRTSFPNAYPGADPEFARYTQFDSSGNVIGGFGLESIITATAHSTYHALQASLTGNVGHRGPSLQASYTWGKALDDTSSVSGGLGATGAVAQAYAQNPFDTHSEKGPATFDIGQAFTLSAVQDLHVEDWGFLTSANRKVTTGWQLLGISTITSGSPFTVYSGVQQTGAGSNGADRPDQIAKPHLSTARKIREDYFGKGANNASYFSIPINLPDGTGPNKGRFGTLGRNTFRGPAFYNYDFALIKDTPFGRRKSGSELVNIQFRSEFFNLFNIVTMGLPANTLEGSGFGVISKTAGNSRQIQLSLKLIY
ncbi:carboxypeptidase regulatory-like domain-containing protein [Granulicella sp. L56]|uniref:TonB-dependent receptor n=1 Tax=Acidobacteriaceae TaxID=204434 RepID=UPI00352C3E0F